MWILWPWYGNWFVVISTYLPHERSLLYYLQFHDMDRALGFPLFWQLIMGASKVMSLDKPTISCRKCAKSRALVMESFISHSRPLDGPPQAQEARPRPRPLLRLWGRGRLRDRRGEKRAVVEQLMSACFCLWISCKTTKKWPNLFFFPLLDYDPSKAPLLDVLC